MHIVAEFMRENEAPAADCCVGCAHLVKDKCCQLFAWCRVINADGLICMHIHVHPPLVDITKGVYVEVRALVHLMQ